MPTDEPPAKTIVLLARDVEKSLQEMHRVIGYLESMANASRGEKHRAELLLLADRLLAACTGLNNEWQAESYPTVATAAKHSGGVLRSILAAIGSFTLSVAASGFYDQVIASHEVAQQCLAAVEVNVQIVLSQSIQIGGPIAPSGELTLQKIPNDRTLAPDQPDQPGLASGTFTAFNPTVITTEQPTVPVNIEFTEEDDQVQAGGAVSTTAPGPNQTVIATPAELRLEGVPGLVTVGSPPDMAHDVSATTSAMVGATGSAHSTLDPVTSHAEGTVGIAEGPTTGTGTASDDIQVIKPTGDGG